MSIYLPLPGQHCTTITLFNPYSTSSGHYYTDLIFQVETLEAERGISLCEELFMGGRADISPGLKCAPHFSLTETEIKPKKKNAASIHAQTPSTGWTRGSGAGEQPQTSRGQAWGWKRCPQFPYRDRPTP